MTTISHKTCSINGIILSIGKWIYRILESIYSEWNRKFFSSFVKVHCEYHGMEWQTIFSAYQHQYKQWVKILY